jgi:type I restriction enzyme S subunit
MNLDTFFEKFELFAEAPNAVAKMRELILDLAIKGQLVAQDPREEGALLLLKAIQEKRRELTAKNYGDVNPSEQPFQIPNNWLWVRLGNIALASDSGWSPQCESEPREGTNWGVLKVSAVSWGVFRPDENKALPPGMDGKPECEVRSGDFLLSRANTADLVARSVIVTQTPPRLMMSDKIVRFSLIDLVCKEFINIANLCQSSREYYAKNASGTSSSMKNVGREVMCNLPIPLPPLAEQKRIVAKVDELMALCDRLEAQQQERETRHTALAQASLTRFADAPTPANLELLFHKAYSIEPAELRKTIRYLAVQGKLVPQRIAEHSAPLPGNNIAQIKNKLGFRLPDSWQASYLEHVTSSIVDCPHSTPKWTDSGKICIKTNQIKPGVIDLSNPSYVSDSEFEERVRRLRPQGDDILYSREGGILGIACRIPLGVELCLGQRLMLFRAGESIVPSFLELVLNSPLITNIAKLSTTGGAAPRVNVSTIRAYPIPLPPLPEQERIVAKVEQLMGLVDRLEAQLVEARGKGAALLEAVVAELSGAV